MTKGFNQQVRNEIINLKKFLTPQQKAKINVQAIDMTNSELCIYGQVLDRIYDEQARRTKAMMDTTFDVYDGCHTVMERYFIDISDDLGEDRTLAQMVARFIKGDIKRLRTLPLCA